MKKEYKPYILPIFTIIAFTIYLVFTSGNPSLNPITGLAVANNQERVDIEIKLTLDPDYKENYNIEVELDDKSEIMTIEKFKKISKRSEIENNLIIYYADLSDFGLGITDKAEEHFLKIKIKNGEEIISESEQIVRSS